MCPAPYAFAYAIGGVATYDLWRLRQTLFRRVQNKGHVVQPADAGLPCLADHVGMPYQSFCEVIQRREDAQALAREMANELLNELPEENMDMEMDERSSVGPGEEDHDQKDTEKRKRAPSRASAGSKKGSSVIPVTRTSTDTKRESAPKNNQDQKTTKQRQSTTRQSSSRASKSSGSTQGGLASTLTEFFVIPLTIVSRSAPCEMQVEDARPELQVVLFCSSERVNKAAYSCGLKYAKEVRATDLVLVSKLKPTPDVHKAILKVAQQTRGNLASVLTSFSSTSKTDLESTLLSPLTSLMPLTPGAQGDLQGRIRTSTPQSPTVSSLDALGSGPRVTCCLHSELIVDITRHQLVRQHRVLTDSEAQDVLRNKVRITEKQAKGILRGDPAIRHRNLAPRTMVCIQEPGDNPDWRIVA